MPWPKTFPPLPPELAKLFREDLLRELNAPDFDASLWCGPPGSGKPLIVETEPDEAKEEFCCDHCKSMHEAQVRAWLRSDPC